MTPRPPPTMRPPLNAAARACRRRNSTNGTTRIPYCALKQPFFSWPKLLAIWLLFLIWVKSADWVNRDTQIFDLGYGKWNPILFFPFLAVLLLFAFPIIIGFANFWLAVGLLSVCLPGDVRAVRRHAQQSGPAARKGVHARLVPLRIRPSGQQSGPEDLGRAQGRLRKGRTGRLDGHRRRRRARQPGQSDHRPPVARLPCSSRN